MAVLHSIKALAAGLLVGAQVAFAATQTVAVLPSEGILNPNELEYFTNKAQEIAVRVLPRSGFEVFPRDVIIRRLGGVDNYYKECKEASCIVDLGKKAQVDYVSQCTFGKFSSDFTVTFELYKVSTSGLVDKFTERAKNINSLLAIMEKRIPEGFLKIPEASPETKTAPPPSEPPPPPPPPPPPEPSPPPVVVPEPFAVPFAVPEPPPPPESEPYTPSVAYESKSGGGEDEEDDEGRKVFSLGLRAGFNFSHLYVEDYRGSAGSYNSALGLQSGMVFDWALSDRIHIQSGVMYVQKGAKDNAGDAATFHYVELPLLLSLKVSDFRLNFGPYFAGCLSGVCSDSEYNTHFDIGISTGLGFDAGMFYVGMFYDYGLVSIYDNFDFYNCTLGLSLGVNL